MRILIKNILIAGFALLMTDNLWANIWDKFKAQMHIKTYHCGDDLAKCQKDIPGLHVMQQNADYKQCIIEEEDDLIICEQAYKKLWLAKCDDAYTRCKCDENPAGCAAKKLLHSTKSTMSSVINEVKEQAKKLGNIFNIPACLLPMQNMP